MTGYATSLHHALTQPYAPYQAIGVKGPDGAYRQLASSLLQIENEFYGTIRPKRVIQSGERPLHALRARGVEYVEVRLMDLNPFLDVGIDAQTLRFLDVFMLHCLQQPSPLDSPAEIASLVRNQQRVAEQGRAPGLRLERDGAEVLLVEWAQDIVRALQPVAAQLDAQHATQDYSRAVADALAAIGNPETLPSARVLQAIHNQYQGSFNAFVLAQSQATRAAALGAPVHTAQRARLVHLSAQSLADQAQIEASDSGTFDAFLDDYLSPARLMPEAAALPA